MAARSTRPYSRCVHARRGATSILSAQGHTDISVTSAAHSYITWNCSFMFESDQRIRPTIQLSGESLTPGVACW